MRVIDSSAWIEWILESPTGEALSQHIPHRSQVIMPTIVQFELSKWLTRHKGENEADRFIAYSMNCVLAPLDTTLALYAAELSSTHKLAMADAIVYATARHHNAELVTCDAHFTGLPGVILMSKTQT